MLLLRDLDEAGRKGAEHDYKLLRQEGIVVYGTDCPKLTNFSFSTSSSTFFISIYPPMGSIAL